MNKRDRRYRDGIDGGILDDDRFRILLLGVLFFLAFAGIALRLYYLQLHRGEEHRRRITGQSVRHIRQPGVRGSIYSADGKLLAGDRVTYDLVFFLSEMRLAARERKMAPVDYMAECAAELARVLGRREYPDAEKIRYHKDHYPGIAMTVFRDLSPKEIALAFEVLRRMPGADVQASHARFCPEKSLASAIIGHARNVDPATAPDRARFKYYIPDMAGISGIEKACDVLPHSAVGLGLRAYPGYSIIQVNSLGYAHRELLGRKEPVNGSDVFLTLDTRAQALGEKLLRGLTGALVAVDADNGDVLCAASSPGYDISKFYPRLTREYDAKLRGDPGLPLHNRAFNGKYPPGSTIKPLISLALLRGGVDPQETVYCGGDIAVGNTDIRCSAHRYAGDDMDMTLALERSCNSYMIDRALKVKLPDLAAVLHEAGIGRRTGLELPEAAGDFPDPARKARLYHASWNDFDTAMLAIGQGFISVTPLQMALVAAAFANGGTIYRPHLVKEIVDASGIVLYRRQVEAVSRINATPEQFEVVRQGMFQVVNSPRGSGRRAAVEGLKVYGKTGTAEVGYGAQRRNITHFIAFVEYRGRRYALCVTVEDGQSGGVTCAPIAAAFLEHYLFGD